MDFQALYTRTEGRISRKTWWIGVLLLAVVNIIISMLILPLVGLGAPNVAAIMAAQSDPAQISALVTGSLQASAWGSLIVFVIFAYPGYCVSVKRRHDRNNNGLDVLIFYVLVAVLLLVQAVGLAYTVTDVQGIPIPMPSMLYSILGGIVGIYGIYMLVVLGFLKGTPGANSFGSDPLVGTGAAATA